IVAASDPALDADFVVASESGQIFRINGDECDNKGIEFARQPHAIYKGVAVETVDGAAVVLAADFHHGRIDAFDARGTLLSCDTSFVDPALPAGYAPFNLLAADGMVYVAYAQQDDQKSDEVAGPGLGLIDVFDAHGNFVRRFTTGGDLNAPWGLARLGGMLYVGNFGDGRITMFDAATAKHLGQVDAAPVDGLWGIVAESPTTLYVAAGPDDEAQGLFARLGP
ncbi:MAG TPA: TIGR03118 family protein, partial [Kofleriaceae bacterium]|nr:TIGR03118 family protein [Kofleriaceae bacterium]